jgi:hypothetical protein
MCHLGDDKGLFAGYVFLVATREKSVTYNAKIPGDKAPFYGIRVDVERYVP